jgi:hypothetical protein
VLRWDARNEDKGKHGKFDHLWTGPYMIQAFRGNNAFLLNNVDGSDLPGAPVNGRMLKLLSPHKLWESTYDLDIMDIICI